MRIGVSGTHGVGKTALVEELCARLTDHTAVDEPYILLEEEGYDFEHPPSLEDYKAQLGRSLLALRSPGTRVVFDRTPLDFLAYLAAYELDIETETDTSALRAALESLDLLVVVPITDEAERVLPAAELFQLRRAVNEILLELVYHDPLQVCGDVPVVELAGRLDGRLAAVLAALPDDPKRQHRTVQHRQQGQR
jgi:hypothetical protein